MRPYCTHNTINNVHYLDMSVHWHRRYQCHATGAEVWGYQGGHCPPKILPAPPVPPKIFRVTSCHWGRSLSESPTQTIDSSLVAKLAPPVAPQNENVWLRPCHAIYSQLLQLIASP